MKTYEKIILKKYSINRLKGKLSNKKDVYITLGEEINGVKYHIDISIWRPDLLLKGEYTKETYNLSIEEYDAKYRSCNAVKLIDERHEFSTIEEVIDYLDKKYLKKEDWIEDEK